MRPQADWTPLQGILDRLEVLQQLRSTGDDLIALIHALIADEDVEWTGDQPLHFVLRLETERAVDGLALWWHGCARWLRNWYRFLDGA